MGTTYSTVKAFRPSCSEDLGRLDIYMDLDSKGFQFHYYLLLFVWYLGYVVAILGGLTYDISWTLRIVFVSLTLDAGIDYYFNVLKEAVEEVNEEGEDDSEEEAGEEGEEDCDNNDEEKVSATNIYQNYTVQSLWVMTIYVCQLLLFGMFRHGLLSGGYSSYDVESDTLPFYLLGSIVGWMVCQTKAEDEIESEMDFWLKARKQILYSYKNKKNFTVVFAKDIADEDVRVVLNSFDKVGRPLMSVTINNILCLFIMFFLPLLLCTSEDAMDFVLNSTAAMFIIELDDKDSTEIKFGQGETELDSSNHGVSDSKDDGNNTAMKIEDEIKLLRTMLAEQEERIKCLEEK